MRIQYNVPGKERKNLAAAVAQEVSSITKYLGPPTFDYEVGAYRIDRSGTIIGADNRSLVSDLQGIHSFVPLSVEYDKTDTAANTYAEHEMRRMKLENQNVPDYSNRGQYGGDDDVPDFEDLQLTEREELGLGCERRESFQGEKGMQPDDVPETWTYRAELSDPNWPDRMEIFRAANDLDAYRFAMDFCEGEVVLLELHELDENYELIRGIDIRKLVANNGLYDTLTIEIPKNGMTDAQVQNLMKLIDSKRTLFAKALGRPLVINDLGETLRFVFPYDKDEGVGNIYAQFATALVNHVMKHQRVTSVEKPIESEKFTMRTLMVRLEMNGGSYAAARKWLCRNLTGNASFPKNTSYADMQRSRRTGKGGSL